MRRFLIFAGSRYYPSGGWEDLKDSANSNDGALAIVANLPDIGWWQIVDTWEGPGGVIVASGLRD